LLPQPEGSGWKCAGGTDRKMHSPYLDRPLIPLAVALPRILTEIEAKIATAEPTERSRLQDQAEVFREWAERLCRS